MLTPMGKYTTYKSVFDNYSHAESLMPLMLHRVVEAIVRGGVFCRMTFRKI